MPTAAKFTDSATDWTHMQDLLALSQGEIDLLSVLGLLDLGYQLDLALRLSLAYQLHIHS